MLIIPFRRSPEQETHNSKSVDMQQMQKPRLITGLSRDGDIDWLIPIHSVFGDVYNNNKY
ncbi:hypothetical protein BOTNAR_0003g00900 [Botryotinia narcissicola]|uniref:Uncharacterized protein n=1 Tax=Botryotinia narcissicola TaxID=278944 RepID=A0A4Z1J9A3_9HELO|nr:hypothetical protein BOTNAR_0003g00900 [Botryotinia narcissicola]